MTVALEPQPAWAGDPPLARSAGTVVLASAGLATALLLADWLLGEGPKQRVAGKQQPVRALRGAGAMLSASVFADSAIEHYRGSFRNPGMYTPLALAALGMAASGEAAFGARVPASVRSGVYGLQAAVGTAGLGFHVYNVLRKPGGISWQNAFYAAPVGAPAALSLAGVIGLAADRAGSRKISRLPLGRILAGITGAGLLGTVGEVALLHFRGAFNNPGMYIPVTIPPLAALLIGRVAVEAHAPERRPLTRAALWATAAVGIAGVGFHLYGVQRMMGGWRNWSQNLIDGPPVPAPPSFTALALAGFAALALREQEDG